MLDVGLGVRQIVAAAPAPPVPASPGKPPFLLSSCSLRHHRLFSNGNAHGRHTTTTTGSRATRRRWWSDPDGSQEDYGSSSLEEDDYGYDYKDEAAFSGFGWAGELFDESWFSKVSKTYGVILPVMLTSMFAATGLKAFLMAMAIPLTQWAISFLLRRERKRNGYSSSSNNYYEGRRRMHKHNYQSWVSEDFTGNASTAVGVDDNAKSSSSSSGDGGGNKSSGEYGGWDELLDNNTVAGAPPKRMRMRIRRRRMPRMMGLESTRYKQAPLLMRWLVAVFPFLGSWFRLL